jgi:hypothetical protein
MVSISNVAKIGGVAIAVGLAYVAIKNASGIGNYLGSTVGGGIAGGLGALGASFNSAFGGLTGGLTHTSAEQIANTGNFTNAINVPDGVTETFSSERDRIINRQLIGLSGLFEGTSTNVDVYNRKILSEGNIQPVSFAFTKEGSIRAGTEGLSDSTIAAQKALSKKYGIATFDVSGAFSNVNGFTSR